MADGIDIKFSTLKGVIQLTGTLAHGVSPSAIRLDFPKQRRPLTVTGDLIVSFEGDRLIWRDCLIDQSTASDSESGQITSVMLLDRRWRWAYQSVSFSFNERNAAGEIRVKPSGEDLEGEAREPDEVEMIQQFFDTQRSAKAIGDFLIAAMGEADNLVDNTLPDDVYPEFSGDEIPPALALGRLCDMFKCSVVLRVDNKVSIVKMGEGEQLPQRLDIMRSSEAVGLNARPESVRLVTKPILWQMDFRLEPVAEELDGNFVPLDSVSYKPDDGWAIVGGGLLIDFLTLGFESEKVQRLNRIASRSVYRMFRPTWRSTEFAQEQDVTDDGLIVPDVANLYGDPLVVYDQIAPFQQRQVATVFKQGAKRPQAPLVYGQYMILDQGRLNVTDDDFEIPPVEESLDSLSIVREGFQVDAQTGIVHFSRPMVYLDLADGAAAELEPAPLYLRIAFYYRDIATRSFVRHSFSEPITPPVVAGLVQTVVVESLEPAVRHDYLKSKPDGGARDGIHLTATTDNFALIEAEARPYLAALKRNIEQDTQPEHVTYAGLVTSIELDGAIRSITWQLGLSGVMTRVQRNQDIGSPTTLSYADMRQIQLEQERERLNDRVPSARLRSEATERERGPW